MTPTQVNKEINIKAPASRVWKVLTDAACMSQWLSDSALEIKSDWKIGSTITFSGKLNGIVHNDRGTILELDPEKILRYNYWTRISRLPDEAQNRTIICFELSPSHTGTLLKLTHSNLVALAAYEHANFYWNATQDMIRIMAETNNQHLTAEDLTLV